MTTKAQKIKCLFGHHDWKNVDDELVFKCKHCGAKKQYATMSQKEFTNVWERLTHFQEFRDYYDKS